MRMQRIALAALACCTGVAAAGSEDSWPASELEQAKQYFQETATLARLDGGRLWGASLAGPMLFVQPRTRRLVANQADAEGKLRPQGAVFVGRLPDALPPANHAVHWAGVHWTMVLWPLPTDRSWRAILLMHESWHRIQADLGFPLTNPANDHLDTLEGRIWLQLEWRALAQALAQRGEARRRAIDDALLFRAQRRSLFPAAAREERELEMNEGLAEYTGVKLSGLPDAEQVLHTIRTIERRPAELATFVRSFAYVSGPAYGLLLDAADANWRKGLKSHDDLGARLQRAVGLSLPHANKEQLQQRAQPYDGIALRAKETRRDQERQERLAHLRARFVNGPVLILPLRNPQFSFDPNRSQPLGAEGTVFPVLDLSDEWGTLKASAGVLMASDFRQAVVVAPDHAETRPLKGQGWVLQLNAGWTLETGKRKGDYRLTKSR